MNNSHPVIRIWEDRTPILLAFLAIAVSILGIRLESITLMTTPVIILTGLLLLKNLRWAFYLFFLFLPFSIEIYLPNGLGTDLPSEPLMWIMTGLGLIWALFHSKQLKKEYILHPISLLLFAHLSWIAFACINSSIPIISSKFFIAKLWYVIPFYFIILYLGRDARFYKTISILLGIALFLAVIYVFIRHSTYQFSFKDVNKAVIPIFRNHVSYACILVVAIPMVWYLWKMAARNSWVKVFWFVVGAAFLLGIYFSYTRAAHVSVFIAIVSYYIIRFRLMKLAIGLTIVGLLVGGIFFLSNSRYLNYAPQYEKTITHFQFDDLLSATTKGEDISTMERVHRWVAGWEMFKKRPFTGFGPGTFYSNYRSYTVSSFKTYVSHNPDKSGIHNYYLMTLSEQGFLGFLIFMGLCFYALLKGALVYHDCESPEEKVRTMAIILMLIIINAILIINDMLEVDKVGPFYFIGLAFIVIQDLKNKESLDKEKLIS
jgi:O-antigen ligase